MHVNLIENMMNVLIGMLLGYIVHDAVQPTAVGTVLDKLALPADLLTTSDKPADNTQNPA